MSTKPKRKAKPRVAKKEKQKPVRKRKVTEEKKKETIIERKPEKKAVEVPSQKTFYLAVRLQGLFGVPGHIEYTLRSLGLKRKFRAVLLEKNDSSLGMLRNAKDHITWGEVRSQDIAVLFKERGELANGQPFSDKFVKESLGQESVEELANALSNGQVSLKSLWQKGVKPVFRLHAPSGGFKSSVKRPFGSQGELGNRGEQISHLVARMM